MHIFGGLAKIPYISRVGGSNMKRTTVGVVLRQCGSAVAGGGTPLRA